MTALMLALLLNPIEQVATIGDNEEVSVLKVDRTPELEFPVPDACAGRELQPSLAVPRFGELADGWPNEMEVEGVVMGLIPGYCGFVCIPGSFRIHVTEGPTAVRGRDLYAATPCVFREDVPRYCGKKVRLKVRKLLHNSGLCGVDSVQFFETKEMPYYVVDDGRKVTVVASSALGQQSRRLITRSSGRTRIKLNQ